MVINGILDFNVKRDILTYVIAQTNAIYVFNYNEIKKVIDYESEQFHILQTNIPLNKIYFPLKINKMLFQYVNNQLFAYDGDEVRVCMTFSGYIENNNLYIRSKQPTPRYPSYRRVYVEELLEINNMRYFSSFNENSHFCEMGVLLKGYGDDV